MFTTSWAKSRPKLRPGKTVFTGMKTYLAMLLISSFAAGLQGATTTKPRHMVGPRTCATCTGSDPCNACKNCRYCKHCAKEGGTCGVSKKRPCLREAPFTQRISVVPHG